MDAQCISNTTRICPKALEKHLFLLDERLQVKSEHLSKEAFQRMDTQLDLSLEKHELLSVIKSKDMKKSMRSCSTNPGKRSMRS